MKKTSKTLICIVLCSLFVGCATGPRLAGTQMRGVFGAATFCPAEPAHTSPGYMAMKDVDDEIKFIKEIWNGDGSVVVGRLTLPKDARVSARIPIYDDGSYCTALYTERRLMFFAHGYEPLEITRRSRIAENVYDAGVQNFVKASPKTTRLLRAKVTAKEPSERPSSAVSAPRSGEANRMMIMKPERPSPAITCVLRIRNDYSLWQDDGNSCGDTINLAALSTVLSSGQDLQFSGLSRIPYVLDVTARGYIRKELPIDQGLNGVIDLGEITLEPATSYRIEYSARVRQNGGKWTGDDTARSTSILCDGSKKFRFTELRDGLGNVLELQMQPNDGDVEASFFYYGDSFYDFGEFNAKEMPSWDDIDISALQGYDKAMLLDGHLYYFTIDDVHGTDIRLLFRVEKM